MSSKRLRKLRLKPNEERRIRRGHLWVYANEIADNLKSFTPGEEVTLLDSRGAALGSGTINPHALIAVRIHSRKGNQPLDADFLQRRINNAKVLRERLGYGDVARIVHAEGDLLPGLIVDRYGEIIAVQHTSAGMERKRETVLAILDELFSPRVVLAADDTPARKLEGLPLERATAGDAPENGIDWFELDGLRMPLDLREGQKTGAYLDQAAARRIIAGYAKGAKVLDAFCFTGSFGLAAAASGASEVVLADSSERALELAGMAFRANDLPLPTMRRIDLLGPEVTASELDGPFDIVVCDPPPLVRSRSTRADGLRKMVKVYADAISRTTAGGLAALFSCSHNAGREDVLEAVKRAGRKAKRRVRRLHILEAGPDHPVLVEHPETEYLHGVLVEVA